MGSSELEASEAMVDSRDRNSRGAEAWVVRGVRGGLMRVGGRRRRDSELERNGIREGFYNVHGRPLIVKMTATE